MTQTISKEAENRILDHISKVVEAVDDGLHPTEAIVKVAKEANLQPNVIRLVSRAYNTGRQESQRKSAESILDKFASFPLADGEAALQAIYPNHVDTPSVARQKTAVSDEYSRPPDFAGLPENRHREKVAHAPMPALIENPAPPYEESSEQRMKRAWFRFEKAKRAHEEKRFQATSARDRFFLAMGKLGNYFKEGGDVPFEQAKWVAENYMGKLGKDMMKIIEHRNAGKKVKAPEKCGEQQPYAILGDGEKAAAVNPEVQEAVDFLNSLRDKQAEVRPPTSVDWTQAPYLLMGDLVKAAEELLAAQRVKLDSEAELQKVADTLCPFELTRSPQTNSIIPRQEKKGFGSFLPIAGGVGLKSVLDNTLTPKTTNELVEDQWMELEDPEHESELRKIRAQAMIQDFMANDEVISGYGPDEILRAYNEVAQMTPRASTQPGVMRPLLRRRLQGHIEPFEAEQATNIEKGIAQTSTLTPNTQRLGDAPASIMG